MSALELVKGVLPGLEDGEVRELYGAVAELATIRGVSDPATTTNGADPLVCAKDMADKPLVMFAVAVQSLLIERGLATPPPFKGLATPPGGTKVRSTKARFKSWWMKEVESIAYTGKANGYAITGKPVYRNGTDKVATGKRIIFADKTKGGGFYLLKAVQGAACVVSLKNGVEIELQGLTKLAEYDTLIDLFAHLMGDIPQT